MLEERIEFFRAFEHDTSRFVDYFKYINPQLKAIIKQRSKVVRIILGARIPTEDPIPKSLLGKNIEYLFAAMRKNGKRIKLTTDIRIDIANEYYWYFIETILTNLMSNTIKYASRSGGNLITIALYNNKNLLCLDYHQTGTFPFTAAAADIRRWLNGDYLRDDTEKGLGHTIIQRVTDALRGNLCIKWKSHENSYKVTKHRVIKSSSKDITNGNRTVLSYLFKFQQ